MPDKSLCNRYLAQPGLDAAETHHNYDLAQCCSLQLHSLTLALQGLADSVPASRDSALLELRSWNQPGTWHRICIWLLEEKTSKNCLAIVTCLRRHRKEYLSMAAETYGLLCRRQSKVSK